MLHSRYRVYFCTYNFGLRDPAGTFFTHILGTSSSKFLRCNFRDGYIVLTSSTTPMDRRVFQKSSPLRRIPRHCTMAASKSSRHTRHYATLQPRTLNVAQSTIRKKWTKLPENSQLRVKQLLRSIELSLHKDSRAGLEVQLIIDDIANLYVMVIVVHGLV